MWAVRSVFVVVEILAASIWIGGMVCLALVAHVARHVVGERSRTALMRTLGARYAVIGTSSLLTSLVVGIALAWPRGAHQLVLNVALVATIVLVGVTYAAMGQARAVGRWRRAAGDEPSGDRSHVELERRLRRGTQLRGAMAVLTLTTVVLVATTLAR